METAHVLSRDLFVRKIRIEPGDSLFYQIRPIRHSIHVSIWILPIPELSKQRTNDSAHKRSFSSTQDIETFFRESGYQLAEDLTSCTPDRFVSGKLILTNKTTTIVALVFDNTSSKSKTKAVSYFMGILNTHSSVDRSFFQSDDFTGYLLKKGRRRLQGWSRRLFWLNPVEKILYYYRMKDDRPCLRGSLPLEFAVVTINDACQSFIIDSGAHIWNLRAESKADYEYWKDILSVCKLKDHPEMVHLDKDMWYQIRLSVRELNDLAVSRIKNTDLNDVILKLKDAIETQDYLMRSYSIDDDQSSLVDWYDATSQLNLDDIESIGESSEVSSIAELNTKTSAGDNRSADEFGKNDLYPLTDQSTLIKRRYTVPDTEVKPPSLLSILSKNIGKELSSISMPLTINEPLSLLQKLAEDLEYSELLDHAANAPYDKRCFYIAAFLVSTLSCFRHRERCIRKPFNPLLGETYELVRPDKGFRFLAEKVSHKPVIVACKAESALWTLESTLEFSQKFWGRSAELRTIGDFILKFSDGQTYRFTKPILYLQNVVFGEKFIHPSGSVVIESNTLPIKAICHFHGSKPHLENSGTLGYRDVIVELFNDGEKSEEIMKGSWMTSLNMQTSAHHGKLSSLIWKVNTTGELSRVPYGFSSFTAQLNEITSLERNLLPSTDSRLREDLRLFENGDNASAAKIKLSLEKWQRDQLLDPNQIIFIARWFDKSSLGGMKNQWKLKHHLQNYWKSRRSQDFSAFDLPKWNLHDSLH